MEMNGPVSRRQSGPEVRSSKRTAAHLSPDPRRRGRGAARRAPRAARQRCEDRARARLASLGAVRPKLGPAALQQPSLRVRLGSLFGDGFCPRGGGEGPRGRGHALARSTAGPALQPLNGSCVPSWGRTPTERLSRLLLCLFVRLLCVDGSGS